MKAKCEKFFGAVVLIAFLAGCGKSSQTTSNQGSPQKNSFWITDVITNGAAGGPAVSEISILRPQRAYLDLHGLTVGKKYVGRFSAKDGAGQEVRLNNPDYAFVPDSSDWAAWHTYLPDYKRNKHGKWKWTVEISELGKFKAEVNVLPPSPDQEKELALHEISNQSAARAFAHYWRVGGDSLFTKIQRVSKRAEVTQDTSLNAWVENGGDFRTNYLRSDEISVLQIKDFSFSAYAGGVSQADLLNGIHYRGGMRVGFRVYRTFEPGVGWTDWQDTSRFLNTGPFLDSLSRIFGPMAPGDLEDKLNLSFVTTERDGNWFVDTSRGDKFSNGKIVTRAQTDFPVNPIPPADPRKFVARETISFSTSAPTASDIQEALAGRTPSRDADAALGGSVREDPAVLEREMINTMESLLNRPLAR